MAQSHYSKTYSKQGGNISPLFWTWTLLFPQRQRKLRGTKALR